MFRTHCELFGIHCKPISAAAAAFRAFLSALRQRSVRSLTHCSLQRVHRDAIPAPRSVYPDVQDRDPERLERFRERPERFREGPTRFRVLCCTRRSVFARILGGSTRTHAEPGE